MNPKAMSMGGSILNGLSPNPASIAATPILMIMTFEIMSRPQRVFNAIEIRRIAPTRSITNTWKILAAMKSTVGRLRTTAIIRVLPAIAIPVLKYVRDMTSAVMKPVNPVRCAGRRRIRKHTNMTTSGETARISDIVSNRTPKISRLEWRLDVEC